MISGQKSAEILERLLSDPDSFLENGELEEADWEPPRPGQLTSLGRDIRLLSAVTCLRARLAQQRKALSIEPQPALVGPGSNSAAKL
jgi:hypothetical protein